MIDSLCGVEIKITKYYYWNVIPELRILLTVIDDAISDRIRNIEQIIAKIIRAENSKRK